MPELFKWVQQAGRVPDEDMRRTFNMGVGMVMVVGPEQLDAALREVPDAFPLGVVTGQQGVRYV
jgi:phosphoribosylaminoimidazole (AIR) synthetase